MTDITYHISYKTCKLKNGTTKTYTQYRPYSSNSDKKEARAARTIIKNQIRPLVTACNDIDKLNKVLEILK